MSGKNKSWNCDEWSEATGDTKLPKYVKKPQDKQTEQTPQEKKAAAREQFLLGVVKGLCEAGIDIKQLDNSSSVKYASIDLLKELPWWAVAAGITGTAALPYGAGQILGTGAAKSMNDMDKMDLDMYRRAAIARKYRREAQKLSDKSAPAVALKPNLMLE